MSLFLWMGVIFWFSSMSRAVPTANPLLTQVISVGGHIVFFGILYLFAARAFGLTFTWEKKKIIISSLIFVAVYGVLDEYHQSFIPTRDPSLIDVCLNILGGLIAAKSRPIKH